MRILLICNKPPYPTRDGGSLAMYSMIRGLLNAGHDVKVLAVTAPKFGVQLTDIPDDFLKLTGLELINTDLSVKPLPALLCLLQGESYQVKRFYNKEFVAKLKEILSEGIDIVQFETVFPAVYLKVVKKYSSAKVVLRAHNIEHQIWDQLAANETNTIKKWYLKKVTESLKRFETKIFSQVDGIAAITDRDRAYIELQTCRIPLISVPFGIDVPAYPLNQEIQPLTSLFHIAAMNWRPNEEGLKWFLEKVWPIVRKKTRVKLVLAGKNMPRWVYSYSSDYLIIEGEVPDSWEFIQQNGIMIVPLLSGSGVRIKIIEGMLAGKPIVSTAKGASGIECTHNQNILIADEPEEFAAALIQCIDKPETAQHLGEKAREFILSHHNNNTIIPRLTEFYKELRD